MSADNITVCPECDEHGLREWAGLGIDKADGLIYELVIEYRCECANCDFKLAYEDRRIVPTKRIGAK